MKMNKSTATGLAVVSLGSVAAIYKGVGDLVRGRRIRRHAVAEYEDAHERLKSAQAPVRDRLAAYGDQQFEVIDGTIGRFVDWMEANGVLANVLSQELVDGLEANPVELAEMRREVTKVRNWIKGAATGTIATIVAPEAAVLGVSALGTAGTGTAITALSGAAAENAVLAWLGGGPLTAGGGGIAAGQLVLGMIAVAPAVFIASLTLARIASKQRTAAEEYRMMVSVACGNIQSAIAFLPMLVERVDELSDVLTGLAARADTAVDRLEAVDFDPEQHADLFATSMMLARSIREVVDAPVLGSRENELTDVSLEVVRKYR